MDATELTARLESLLPGFHSWSESDANVSDPDRVHGVFAAATEYSRTHAISPEQWSRLAEFLSAVVGGADHPLDEAARTTFLKKLAAPDHPLGALLQGEARTYWEYWV